MTRDDVSMAEVLFDGPVRVDYGFIFLSARGDEPPDMDESRAGQINGLLGGASAAGLSITTATHTGSVALRVEWLPDQPAVNAQWEEVVEASMQVDDVDVVLSSFGAAYPIVVPQAGAHRARLSAVGLDAAQEEVEPNSALAPDRYLLQLWPAPAAGDRVIRQTSQAAAYWHAVAQGVDGSSAAEDDDGWEPWSREERDFVAGIPMSRRVEVPAVLAHLACEQAGLTDINTVRELLSEIDRGERRPWDDSVDGAVVTAAVDLLGPEGLRSTRHALRVVAAAASRPYDPSPWESPSIEEVRVLIEQGGRALLGRYQHHVDPVDLADDQYLLDLIGQTRSAAGLREDDTTVVRQLAQRLGLPLDF